MSEFERSLPTTGFWGATSANIVCMVGMGPFLTIPLALSAMGGPQALLGWILGAAISICDGLVWAELGSAIPQSGGSCSYLLEGFGPRRYGRLFAFLLIWQNFLTGPLIVASGAVGFAQYAGFLFPVMHRSAMIAVAVSVCLFGMVVCYRNIESIGRVSVLIGLLAVGLCGWVIVSAVGHFHSALAFDFPPHAFTLSRGFFVGLGAATLISVYDYGGYWTVCMIGSEVKNAKRNIPLVVLTSLGIIAALYLAMCVSITGVLPWREAMQSQAIVSEYMRHIYGPIGERVAFVLMAILAFGSSFPGLLGISRILYAGAKSGEFFEIFGRLHPREGFPYISVLAAGLLSAIACLFTLQTLITAAIVIQTLLQFMGQSVAVMLLRRQRRNPPDTYRMPLYPLPALVALAGWAYIVMTSGARNIGVASGLLGIGIACFMFRAYRQSRWPFAGLLDETSAAVN